MTWLRNLAALAAGAALLLTPHLLSPSAATSHSATSVAVAPARAATEPLVQGVVTDQFGNFVDGVTVRATRSGGAAAASAETYASVWADGPQHGYFYLEVGRTGTYTLTLAKNGYETVEYDEVMVTRRGQKLSLGEIQIEKVLASTSTNAMLTRRAVATRDRASLVVAVTTKATQKPTGEVEVREGNKVVGSVVLKPGHRGNATVTLTKLGKGGHVLRAYFLGSEDLAPSSSKRPVTLVIGKSKK
jgi:hypothetical protein